MTAVATVTTASAGDRTVVAVTGEVDLSNADEVDERLAAAIPVTATHVVLDLTATTYVDSSAIAVLFRVAERCGYHRQELRLVAPPAGKIRLVLELTRVHDVIPVDDALA